MSSIVINGRFLTQPLTGVQRVARELCREFSRVPDASIFSLIIPPGVEVEAEGLGLPFQVVGSPVKTPLGGFIWENRALGRVARGRYLLNLANRLPLRCRSGAVLMHDAHVFDLGDSYRPFFRHFYRFQYGKALERGLDLVTVSGFSQVRLAHALGVKPDRWTVIPNGGDHLQREVEDESVLLDNRLQEGRFLLSVGTPARHKNLSSLGSLAEVAERADMPLVVVGHLPKEVYAPSEIPRGICLLGRISDARLKALYRNAFCLVFPSLYEGFGLPPLEAMTLECPVVVSDISPLRELCGPAALYFDPRDPQTITHAVLALLRDEHAQVRMRARGRERSETLTWRRASERWLEFLSRARRLSAP